MKNTVTLIARITFVASMLTLTDANGETEIEINDKPSEERDQAIEQVRGRGKAIFDSIITANSERAPLGLGDVWPKAGKPGKRGTILDINKEVFESCSDFFTVFIDGENYGAAIWAPFGPRLGWALFAGGEIPPKEAAGHLTAANNIWAIAANIEADMLDCIPILITRNVDPASLIPEEGDLSKQCLRPSSVFTTPFGDKGVVLVMKGGAIIYSADSLTEINLEKLYKGQSLQGIRSALQKVKYLTP